VAQLKARLRDGHVEEREPTIINDSSRYSDNRYLRITGELASSSLPNAFPLPLFSCFSLTRRVTRGALKLRRRGMRINFVAFLFIAFMWIHQFIRMITSSR